MATDRPNPFLRNRAIHLAQAPHVAVFSPEPDQIRLGTTKDLAFVEHTLKKFGHALGFIPRLGLEKSLEGGHIRICNENGDAAGYILSRPHLAWQPALRSITHAAVHMDAQRRHHGLAMLKTIEAEALADGLLAIQACCAVGLDSNDFWRAAGFIPIAHLTPETKSAREIICWRKPLRAVMPIWFAMLPERSGHKALPTVYTRDIHRTAEHGTADPRFLATETG
jgi:N-acetylglutamate synthase-like GNAT family acetyltransferase